MVVGYKVVIKQYGKDDRIFFVDSKQKAKRIAESFSSFYYSIWGFRCYIDGGEVPIRVDYRGYDPYEEYE